jgi:hypothetical protein
MLFKTFMDEYNGWACHLSDIAEIACDVQDDKVLVARAEAFVDAYYDFESYLEEIGFELG